MVMRIVVKYLWIAVTLAVLNLGLIWLSRDVANRRMEQARRARERQPSWPGESSGTGLRILQFYANSGDVVKGEKITICYGVENAKAVALDPPVDRIQPAANRCLEAAPRQTTTYTLAADGENGTRLTASFTVKVRPAPPYILFVELSDQELRRGTPLTMCYGVRDATETRLLPAGWKLPPTAKHCFRMVPVRTTDYTLLATGPGGKDQEKFTITVR